MSLSDDQDPPSHDGTGDHLRASARVLVVDDHAGVRSGIIRLIATGDDFEVVGEAANGVEAVHLASRLAPDLVLMDVSMPVVDGVEATGRIAALPDPPAILLFTAWADRDRIAEAIAAGASGHILKDAPPAEIFRALRAALATPRANLMGEVYGGAVDEPTVSARQGRQNVVVATRSRSGEHQFYARAAGGAVAVIVLGSAGVAAAREGRLPAPIQAAARLVGLPTPTPTTRLDDARRALDRLDAALRSGNNPTISAAADALRRRLSGLTASDQARLGSSPALSAADRRLGVSVPSGQSAVSLPVAPGGATGGSGSISSGDGSSPSSIPGGSGGDAGRGGGTPSGGGGSPGGPPATTQSSGGSGPGSGQTPTTTPNGGGSGAGSGQTPTTTPNGGGRGAGSGGTATTTPNRGPAPTGGGPGPSGGH